MSTWVISSLIMSPMGIALSWVTMISSISTIFLFFLTLDFKGIKNLGCQEGDIPGEVDLLEIFGFIQHLVDEGHCPNPVLALLHQMPDLGILNFPKFGVHESDDDLVVVLGPVVEFPEDDRPFIQHYFQVLFGLFPLRDLFPEQDMSPPEFLCPLHNPLFEHPVEGDDLGFHPLPLCDVPDNAPDETMGEESRKMAHMRIEKTAPNATRMGKNRTFLPIAKGARKRDKTWG